MNKKLTRIICAFVWNKTKREHLRYKLSNPDLKEVEKWYQKHIKKLKKSDRKIRVCFYVTENQKWKGQMLFDALRKNDHFEVFAVFAPRTQEKYKNEHSIQKNIDFFKKNTEPLYIGYDTKTGNYTDLKEFHPDIVFYSQPWDIPPIHQIKSVAKYALTCYIPYAIAEAITPMLENVNSFHYYLWRHYTAHDLINKQYKEKIPYKAENLKAVGYPTLNEIMNTKVDKNNSVIYAPHPMGNTWINYWTFDWNGDKILAFAKKHPEINWIFKPHPDFRWASTGFLGEDYINNYFDGWAKIGRVYEGGAYAEIFQQSRCMITDCSSFLSEYFVTGNPVIHLRNPKAKDYNGLNDVVKEAYYKVWNPEQLDQILHLILEKGEDPMKEERKELFERLGLNDVNAANNISKDLEKEFF